VNHVYGALVITPALEILVTVIGAKSLTGNDSPGRFGENSASAVASSRSKHLRDELHDGSGINTSVDLVRGTIRVLTAASSFGYDEAN
jgi:hypothetical protein